MRRRVSAAHTRDLELVRLQQLAQRRALSDREADRLAELTFIVQRHSYRTRYAALCRLAVKGAAA